MTDSHRNYYIFYFITLRHTHPQESSSASFFLCWSLPNIKSRVPTLHFFLDPQRGYVTVYWSRIRVLSSTSEGRPLAAVIINDCWIPGVYWYSGTPVSDTHTHIKTLLELSEFKFQVPVTKSPTRRPRLLVPTVPGSLKFQVPETPNGCLRRPRFVAFSDVRASQKVHTLGSSTRNSSSEFQKLSTAVYDVRALWLSLTSALPKSPHTFGDPQEIQVPGSRNSQRLSTTSALCGFL